MADQPMTPAIMATQISTMPSTISPAALAVDRREDQHDEREEPDDRIHVRSPFL
jgi:hypothetical protein